MPAVATMGSYRRNSFRIYITACLAFAVWFAYDAYFSDAFIQKHSVDGKPDSTLMANRYAPPVLAVAAAIIAFRWWMVKDKKIVADGKTLILENGAKIDYDKIEKIDKTNFDKKGYFTLTYTDDGGKQAELTLSDRNFDKIEDILAELVSAIQGA
jgi:hypothetical protein